MKIVTISDTHNQHKKLKLPDGDLLIHAGDFSSQGFKHEISDFIKWLNNISHKYTYGVVFIAGNHDKLFDPKFCSEDDKLFIKNTLLELPNNIKYLENNYCLIENIKIWGSPITPWFHGDYWAFNKYRGDDIKQIWEQIPFDTDILITHGPVFGKCDYIPYSNEYVGCEDLKNIVKKYKIPLFISGHIHESYGIDYDENTIYINTSICNFSYNPINKPFEIIFEKGKKIIIN